MRITVVVLLELFLLNFTSYGFGKVESSNDFKIQQTMVEGVVVDDNGMPIPGVNVQEENSNNGTFTDFDGKFEITVASEQSVLTFSFTGMAPVRKAVGKETSMNIVLREDAQALSEVVIVGYGTQKRSEVTGSISNVSGESISSSPVQSFDSALGGQATGVNMVANAGVLNQAPVFRIRGTNSLSLSSYPLIVVDGVPMFTSEDESGIGYASTNPLSSLNPADIESIDIAKDAAATSIYGSRAANGVVFVTTKKGKGKARVSYDGWVGFTKAAHTLNVLNAEQYIEIKNEGLMNEGTYDPDNNYYDYSLDSNGNRIDTDWRDYIYRTGVSHNHNINVSGATETTRYFGSVGYTNQEGIFQKNSFDRKSVMFNIDNNTTEWLNLGAKINYVNENNNSAMSTGAAGNETATGAMARLPLMTAPIASPFNNDGTFNNTSSGFVGLQDNEGHLNQSRLGFTNPALSMKYNHSGNEINQIRSDAYAELTPFEWLSLKTLYSIDYRNTAYDIYFSPLTNEGRTSSGTAENAHNKRQRWVWTNTLSASKTFADLHSVDLLLGQEQQKTDGSRFGLQRTGQTDPYYSNIQGGWQNVFVWQTDGAVVDNYLTSLFGRIQYNFDEKYFITANLRQDKYSALGINNKKGTFWGFSGGWEITKENFWHGLGLDTFFSSFKIRGSYGQVGNVDGLDDFAAINAYSANLYGGEPGLSFTTTGNPDLKWETSKKAEVGIDLGLFDDRLNAEITYYNNDIDGLIFGVPVPPSAGVPNSTLNTILQNVGSMYNRGVELSLRGYPVVGDDFSWSSFLNFSVNRNRVTKLAEGIPSIISSRGYSITLPGQPVGMINAVLTDGIDPETGRMTFLDHDGNKVFYQQVTSDELPYRWTYEDGSEAPPITPASDAVPYKNSAPKIYGGFSNSFKYGNFGLDVMLTYQLGGYLYSGTQATMRDQRFWNNSTDVLRRWQKPGDITDIARIVNGDNVSMGNTMAIDENVMSSDFLRLKNVNISYTLPKTVISKLNLSNIMVYASGQNLAVWTKYGGMDPEVTTDANNPMTQGIDRNQAPNARTYTLGIKLDF